MDAPQDPPVDDTKQPSDEQMNDSSAPPATSAGGEDEGAINESSNNNDDDGLGSGIRPIFLGNLSHGVLSSDVENLFRNPVSRESQYSSEEKEEGMASEIAPFDLERVVSRIFDVCCVYIFCRTCYFLFHV
jgi:hypothetical protein